MAGIGIQLPQSPGTGNPLSLFGNPASYTAAATQQASDYDTIMAEYANLAKSPLSLSPVNVSSLVAPQTSAVTTPYSQSGDVTSSLSKLSDLAYTGGYSPSQIAEIRARAISPIRSIYSSAQQNIERQKALAGGYSPNYTAATAELSRDEANQIGDQTTSVEAQIAQNQVANEVASAPQYASAAASANAAQDAANARNTAIVNSINEANANRATQVGEFNVGTGLSAGEFNSGLPLAARQGVLGAIQGQASLYGTTPALTSTFGNQVVQAGQLGQGQQQQNTQKQNSIINAARLG